MFRVAAPFLLFVLGIRRGVNLRKTRAGLERRNLRRFRALVAFAAKRSPHYAGIVRERGIDPRTARPEQFPILTKREFNDRFDLISTNTDVKRARVEEFLSRSEDPRELMDGRYHVLHTTGTSGEISFAVFSRAEWLHAAVQFERVVRFGLRKRIAYVGVTRGHHAGVSLALGSVAGVGGLGYRIRAFDLEQPRRELLAALNAFRPRALAGYTRALVNLAGAQRRGELRISPRVILCGGEALTMRDKGLLYQAFRADIRDLYACSEHLYVGVSLPHDPGMYLVEDNLIVEPREDCTLVTNLFNRTLPLIRHRLDDVLRPAPENAGSFGPYRIVGNVVGRTEHAPLFRDANGHEVAVDAHAISGIVLPNLRAFQVVQTGPESFRFFVVPGDGSGAAREALLAGARALWQRMLDDRGLGNVRFEVEAVHALEPDPKTGKFQLVRTPERDAL